MSTSEQPQQLTFRHFSPVRDLRGTLSLSGTLILGDVPDGDVEDLRRALVDCGVDARVDDTHGMHFDARDLVKLRGLSSRVTLTVDESLTGLWRVLVERVDDGLPLTLDTGVGSDLAISWFDGEVEQVVDLSKDAAVAFLQSEVVFTATAGAWAQLEHFSSLPLSLGTARVTLEGAIEITSPAPQLLEHVAASTLRGLYQLDDARFGVPLAFASDVGHVAGLRWEGPEPSVPSAPSELDVVPIELSTHHQQDLGQLVENLAAYQAQVIVWDSGLGRRVFALAALTVLDAWPLLLVTPPSAVWAWQRHLDLLGRKWSLRHGREDVHIVTYRDLAQRDVPLEPSSIIFDQLSTSDEVRTADVQRGLHRLDGLWHAYRLAVDSSWPEDLGESTHLLSLVKPSEFSRTVPVAQRYPLASVERARDHVSVYLSRRTRNETSEDDVTHRFRRSSVLALTPSDAQLVALRDLRERGDESAYVLAESLEIVSNGTAQSLSPKIGAVAQRVRHLAARGRRVCVVTRHDRTAVLLRGVLRGVDVAVVSVPQSGEKASAVQLLVSDGALSPLGGFDEVIFMDYPWSFTAIERAVGSAAALDGPGQVTCVHLVGTLDDRLAMLAARRREFDKISSSVPPPDFVEVDYLLAA